MCFAAQRTENSVEIGQDAALIETLLHHPRYEVVPISGAREQAGLLPAGTSVAVTCSPTRGLGATVELAAQLAVSGLDAIPHLAARVITGRTELEEALARLAAVGVSDVFVIGGDGRKPSGPYASGLELLQAIDDLGHDFSEIGVPVYPEGHPFIEEANLYEALREKAAFATYAVSQMCFDGSVIATWLAGLRGRGIELPVSLGVPGVVDSRRLARMSVKIGVGESSRFARSNAKAVWRLLRPGGYKPNKLLRELATLLPADGGAAGIHLFTFNEVAATQEWVRAQSQRTGYPDAGPGGPPAAAGSES
jgi:methylenetetrahydrofolate reductase (NADPH)